LWLENPLVNGNLILDQKMRPPGFGLGPNTNGCC
jgi:hypothetical protein